MLVANCLYFSLVVIQTHLYLSVVSSPPVPSSLLERQPQQTSCGFYGHAGANAIVAFQGRSFQLAVCVELSLTCPVADFPAVLRFARFAVEGLVAVGLYSAGKLIVQLATA